MVAVPLEAAQEAVGVQVADVQLGQVEFGEVRAEGLVFAHQGSALETRQQHSHTLGEEMQAAAAQLRSNAGPPAGHAPHTFM